MTRPDLSPEVRAESARLNARAAQLGMLRLACVAAALALAAKWFFVGFSWWM